MTDDADLETVPDEWRGLLREYQRRIAMGRSMGGQEKLARRAAQGRPNARQMIAALVDADSFMELGTLAGSQPCRGEAAVPADALVGGLARIDGRPVVVACEDFTSMGGSIGHATNAKRVRLANLALHEQVPYVSLLEGSGERATNALQRHPYAPNDLQILARLSGVAPTVAIVVGASAGHGALTGLLKDFVIMTDDACMFSAGPPLVAMALGEQVSKVELGGADLHATISGVCHNRVKDTAEAFATARRFLALLPSSAYTTVPRRQGPDTAPRRLDGILSIVPRDSRQAYDMRAVIAQLVDSTDDLLEIQPHYGRSIITALARLGGYAVGIVANQPSVLAGAIDAAAADKATHFINLCSAYHLPVAFLADNPGVLSGTAAERQGTLRAAAAMYAAQARLRSAKLHVTLRKAFGFGSSLMAMNPFDQQTLTLAFPGIQLGGIPASGGAQAAGVPDDTQARMAAAERDSAWLAGDAMAYDEIIDPRQLRNALITGLELSAQRLSRLAAPTSAAGIAP